MLLTAFWSIHHLGGEGAFAKRTMIVASAGDHLVTLRVRSVCQILSHWHGHFGGNFLSKLSLFGFKWDIATRLALSLMLTMLGVQGASMDVTASIEWRYVSYLMAERSLGQQFLLQSLRV